MRNRPRTHFLTPSASQCEPAAVELVNVTLQRGGSTLLKNLSLRIPYGSTTAVIGANGAGKSTLLRVLEGYEYPSSGRVTVLGQTLGETNLAHLRTQLRLVGSAGTFSSGGASGGGGNGGGGTRDFPPDADLLTIVATASQGQLVHYQPLTTEERKTALAALRSTGLASRAHTKWAHASAGEKVRTLLACTRIPPSSPHEAVTAPRSRSKSQIRNPQSEMVLLLLDEPTSGLDPAARAKTIHALAKPPKHHTQLIVTHHLEELPHTTSLALVLKKGRPLAFGPAKNVLTSKLLSNAFNIPLKVTHTPHSPWPWSTTVKP